MSANKMRGQAWVAFRDVQASTQAMRSLQGFDFFGKQMVRLASILESAATLLIASQKVQYAKGKSDKIAKLDGTYRMSAPTGNITTSTDLQQQIFGAPPSSLSVPAKVPPTAPTNGGMEVEEKEGGTKGTKRGRDEDSDEEVDMEEDSDAPMEEGSDEDD